MKDFSDVLFCSDFDGTLFTDGKISDEDAEAIKYFQSHGGAFTLCTGRMPFVLDEKGITSVSLNAPVVCMNGAMIYDTEKNEILYEDIMPPDVTEVIFRICDTTSTVRHICIPASNDLNKSPMIMLDQRDKIAETIRIGAYKVVFFLDSKDDEKTLRHVMSITPSKFGVSRSWSAGIEIQNASNSKGLSARKLCGMLGRHTLICAGDYENDISMLREADIGFAVANACPALKAAADRITNNSVGGAIAEIIYSL